MLNTKRPDMSFPATDWIVHVDETILVVNKPPGLPTLPDGYNTAAPHIKSIHDLAQVLHILGSE